VQDDSPRLSGQNVAGREQARAPFTVLARGNRKFLVEGKLRQHVPPTGEVVGTSERDSLSIVLRRRRQNRADQLRRLREPVSGGAVDGETSRSGHPAAKRPDQPLDPLGLRLAIVIGEADVAPTGRADAAISRRGGTRGGLPQEPYSRATRHNGFDSGAVLRAVVHDEDLG
jgi:hypothetical protein